MATQWRDEMAAREPPPAVLPTIPDKDALTRQVVLDAVRVTKVTRCYNPKINKLETYIPSSPEFKAAESLLMKTLIQFAEGDLRQGVAPKSDAERAVSKYLEKRR